MARTPIALEPHLDWLPGCGIGLVELEEPGLGKIESLRHKVARELLDLDIEAADAAVVVAPRSRVTDSRVSRS